jgi:hypothetical protein
MGPPDVLARSEMDNPWTGGQPDSSAFAVWASAYSGGTVWDLTFPRRVVCSRSYYNGVMSEFRS